MHRGHVDDAAPVGGLHGGQRQAGGVEGAGQVDGQDGIPFVDREVLDLGHVLDAGVVDQDVDAAEALGAKGHHGLDLVGAAHVGAVVVHRNSVGLAGGGHLGLGALRIAKTVQKDVGPLGCQRLCNPEADAAGGTCDQSCFALEHLKSLR